MEHFKYMLATWSVVSTCYGGLIHVKVFWSLDVHKCNYFHIGLHFVAKI